MSADGFKFGDRVVHTLRPEWGTGVVTAAQAVVENGQKCQRLTLRFDRAGLKTLSTSIAELRLAGAEDPLTESPQPANGATLGEESGWLAKLEAGAPLEIMARLPESTRDPFVTLAQRIKATLELYRFSDRGGTLLDWAAAQTGLKDPLARFNRHELEEFFKRYAFERDAHLARLMQDARKQPSAEIDRLMQQAPPAARDALRKGHHGR